MRKTVLLYMVVCMAATMVANPTLYYKSTKEVTQGEIIVTDDGNGNYTLTAVPQPGYAFYQWSDGVATPSRQICCLSADSAFRAQFAKIIVVTLKGNPITSDTLFAGCSIDAMPPCELPEGWMLEGWTTVADDLSTKVSFPYTPTADITLYPYAITDRIIVNTSVSTAQLGVTQDLAAKVTVIVENEGVLTVSEDSKTSQLDFKSIYVQGGGKLVLPNGTYLATSELILQGGDADAQNNYIFRYPQMVVNGTLNVSNNVIYYDYLLSRNQQYSLCLPEDVTIANISYADGTSATLGTDYQIAHYNGASRAAGGAGWEYIAASTTTLTKGVGYTIYANPQLGQVYSRLRFPLPITTDYTEDAKSVAIVPHTAAKPNDAGWNLVGNPYYANFSGQDATDIQMGQLILVDGQYQWQGGLRYVVMPDDDGKGYQSVLASQVTMSAFKNAFMQIASGSSLLFDQTHRAQSTPIRKTVQDKMSQSIVLTTEHMDYKDLQNKPYTWAFNNHVYSEPGCYVDTIINNQDTAVGKLLLSVTYEKVVYANPGEVTSIETPWGSYALDTCQCLTGCLMLSEDSMCIVDASLCVEEPLCIDSLVYKKWDDVIFCDNGNQEFVAFQWYRDNILMTGETKQYYFHDGGIDGAEYFVEVTCENGTKRRTCPMTFGKTPRSADTYAKVQTVARRGGIIHVEMSDPEAEVTIYTMVGQRILTTTIYGTHAYLPVPMCGGIYVLNLVGSNVDVTTKIKVE